MMVVIDESPRFGDFTIIKFRAMKPYNVMRWVARITGSLMCLVFLFFFVGEAISPHKSPNEVPIDANSVLQLTLTFIGIIGLLLAWKWELPGGVIAIVAFLALGMANPRTFPFPLAVFLVPAILFIITGWLDKRTGTAASGLLR